MVDRDGRAAAAAEIEGRLVEEQKRHLAAFEKLETADGLDLDVLTDIFGLGILDASKPHARELLDKFNKLYEELTSGSDLFCAAGVEERRLPGCTGFGQEAKYERVVAVAVIIEDPSTAEVVCVPASDDSKPRIVLKGTGFVLSAQGELPSISDPQEVEFLVAGIMEHSSGLEVPKHNLDVTCTDDDGLEIYKALDSARGMRGIGGGQANDIVGWTRNYWPQRARQLRGAQNPTTS